VTKPTRTQSGRISGLGTNFGPELRKSLAPQFMKHLATIHTLQPLPEALPSFAVPRIGTTDSARWLVNHARRVWEEDRDESNPLMEVAAEWLVDNLPALDNLSIVHGDYRSGNFLFDEQTGHVNAWLDWERGHLGDRHRDLAWTTQKAFGHYDEDGQTYYVSGLVPLDDFYSWYEEETGLSVDQDRLDFYRILNCFQIIVSIQATTFRVVRLGKSHQDIMLSRVKGMTPVIAQQLHDLLKEKI
jgi:aminoglycoside phosphotransferase (APT) family kinase protein